MKTLSILTGPTAVGKTALALEWAESRRAVVVSCDSLLVYRGMNIGSAKPTPAELARVPHRCVDIADPAGAPYDVAEYVSEARRSIDEAFEKNRPVLVVGGSGFYLKSFFAAVTDDLAIPDGIRKEVAALAPASALARLRAIEPHPPHWLDLENPRRVMKALERRLASGIPLAELKAEFDRRPGAFDDFEKRLVVLTRSPESLNARIDLRISAMLRDGLIDEVKTLLKSGLNSDSPAAVAVGYRETITWLAKGEPGGERSLAEAIATSTRRLAAKQRKWIRSQLPTPLRAIDLDLDIPAPESLFDP